MDRPKIGVGVVVLREGQILLGKRKGAHGAGEWSLPGGHLEYSESIESCAKRELTEETGLTAISTGMLGWTNDVIEENKHYITFFVQVDAFSGEPALREPLKCEGWSWFPVDSLPKPLFKPIQSLLQERKLQTQSLTLSVLTDRFGICRLDPQEPIPNWANGPFFSIVKTAEELSVVCLEENIPSHIRAERGWRAIKVEGPLDFSLTGILASLSKPLADGGVSLFAISTYDTDYLLVKEANLPKSFEILGKSCKIVV